MEKLKPPFSAADINQDLIAYITAAGYQPIDLAAQLQDPGFYVRGVYYGRGSLVIAFMDPETVKFWRVRLDGRGEGAHLATVDPSWLDAFGWMLLLHALGFQQLQETFKVIGRTELRALVKDIGSLLIS